MGVWDMGWDPVYYVHLALRERMPNILFRTIPDFFPSPPSLTPSLAGSDRIGLHLSLYVFESEEGDDDKCV